MSETTECPALMKFTSRIAYCLEACDQMKGFPYACPEHKHLYYML